MAAAPDGYIRISTKIDQKGVDNGLLTLTASLKRFARVMTAAFATGAIGLFVKESIRASNLLTNAMIGLQSIAEGQGKSFDQAKEFIQSYISDGLVPAADAVTAYKNLLLRGYSTEQIEKVMVALKDSAAFARNASLSMGEAVASASEGLKNENSILVDNAGVTKNVAKMWQEYAAELGVSVTSLTQAQKVQAEVNGILKETRFQTGDAAKLVNTYSGQVAMLSFQFTNLKQTLGGAFTQILTPALKLINQLLVSLNAAATVFANFITALTGQSLQVVTATTAAADAVDDLTESTEASGDAAKKASKSLASFDELNVLQGGSTDGADKSASAAVAASADTATSETVAQTNNALDTMKAKLLEFFGIYQIEIQRVRDGWENIKNTAVGIWDAIKSEFASADIGGAAFETVLSLIYMIEAQIDLIVGAVGNLFKSFNIPAAVESALNQLSSWFKTLGDVVVAVTPGIMAFVDTALIPIAEWIGEKLRDAFSFFSKQLDKVGDWFADHTEQFKQVGQRLGDIAGAIWNILEPIGDAVWETAKDIIGGIVDGVLAFSDWCLDHQKTIENIAIVVGSFAAAWWLVNAAITVWNVIGAIAAGVTGGLAAATSIFSGAIAFLTSPIMLVILAIGALIAIVVLLVNNWEWVKEKATIIWNAIAEYFSKTWQDIREDFWKAWDAIKAVWEAVSGWFKEHVITPLQDAFQGFKDTLIGIWDGLWGGIKSVLNFIITGVENFINRIVSGINLLIGGFNKVASLGSVVGLDFSLPYLTPVSLPRLAKGAVIPPNREFVAVLGDQRHGTNIEAPLATMVEAFKQALSEMDGVGAGGDIKVNVEFKGPLSQLGRVLQPAITVETARRGKAAVKGVM